MSKDPNRVYFSKINDPEKWESMKPTKEERIAARRLKNPCPKEWKHQSRKEQQHEKTDHFILPVPKGSRPLTKAEIRKAFSNELSADKYTFRPYSKDKRSKSQAPPQGIPPGASSGNSKIHSSPTRPRNSVPSDS